MPGHQAHRIDPAPETQLEQGKEAQKDEDTQQGTVRIIAQKLVEQGQIDDEYPDYDEEFRESHFQHCALLPSFFLTRPFPFRFWHTETVGPVSF